MIIRIRIIIIVRGFIGLIYTKRYITKISDHIHLLSVSNKRL